MPVDRPQRTECEPYYFLYIDRVPEGDVLALLERQLAETPPAFRTRPEDVLRHRYAPDKWSIKEVLGHLIDTERAFSYRAFSFARAEPAALPSFEQDDYVARSRYHDRPIGEILDEYVAVRSASLALFRSCNDEEWGRTGTASGFTFTTRSIPFILAGHEIHHRAVIENKYLSQLAKGVNA